MWGKSFRATINSAMKVYVFGNQDVEEDKAAFDAVRELEGVFKGVTFVIVKPNEDLPFVGEEKIVILDTVAGISEVRLITGADLDKIVLPPRGTVHDFDLGFQLKYLKKLGKLGEIMIIGLPQGKETDYLSIHSILRKLVAQDMQGS